MTSLELYNLNCNPWDLPLFTEDDVVFAIHQTIRAINGYTKPKDNVLYTMDRLLEEPVMKIFLEKRRDSILEALLRSYFIFFFRDKSIDIIAFRENIRNESEENKHLVLHRCLDILEIWHGPFQTDWVFYGY